jgi:putative hydrolase of the HAD superfamily
MIRAVTFDLWETLIREDAAASSVRAGRRVTVAHEALASAGHAVSRETLELAHEEVWKRMEVAWRNDRDFLFEDQVRLFLELAVGGPLSGDVPPRVIETYADAALDAPPSVEEAARGVLEVLAGWGLKVGLISNTGRTPGTTLRKLLDRAGLLCHFGVTLFSNETIIRKPHPEIFHRALAALDAAPSEAVHVGDSAEADMAGAKAAGMRTIHLWRGVGARSMRCADADYVIESLEEVPSILARLRGDGG